MRTDEPKEAILHRSPDGKITIEEPCPRVVRVSDILLREIVAHRNACQELIAAARYAEVYARTGAPNLAALLRTALDPFGEES